MKMLLLLFVVLSLQYSIAKEDLPTIDIHGHSHREYTLDDTELVPTSSDLGAQSVPAPALNQLLIGTGKEIARIAFAQSYQKIKNELLLQAFAGLPNTPVVWPQAGYDYKACDSTTLAFVIRGVKKIHICRQVIDEDLPSAWVGQIIVHEMAHVIGLHNECHATALEVVAMSYSSYGLQFKNGYYASCIGR